MTAANLARDDSERRRTYLFRRFLGTAHKFWTGATRWKAWGLTAAVILFVILQVGVQYRINLWNRDMFDALEQKDGAKALYQSLLFLPLVVSGVIIAVMLVNGRMTMQRSWRRWVTDRVIGRWFTGGRYYHLNFVEGDHKNPEHRIAEDVRIATEMPIDFVVGVLQAFLTAATFIGVLWFVGGEITVELLGSPVTVPGFLVIAAAVYAVLASTSMAVIGWRYVAVSEAKMQSEAELRYALTRVRENGESIALIAGEEEERIGLRAALNKVIERWRTVAGQVMRTMAVAQTSYLVAPVIPIILCAPKYLAGTMTLGQVMQAASAFVIVQHAFNWLADNYARLADWTASARRVSSLLVSLDALEKAENAEDFRRIVRGETKKDLALELKMLSVRLDDGTAVVRDAEVEIAPGERVLIVGESGTGKSTLVRAIAGLWPWGGGEVLTKPGAKIFFLPQKPYMPLGSLRRAVAYPMNAEDIDRETVVKALKAAGLEHFAGRIDEDESWDQTLSGGEKQRLAFARLLVHKPDLIVMDEGTSALDVPSQEKLLNLIREELPKTTLISIGHRPELEAFHDRKITIELEKSGARIVSDEPMDEDWSWLDRLFRNPWLEAWGGRLK